MGRKFDKSSYSPSQKELSCVEDKSACGEQLKTDLNKIIDVPIKICKAFDYDGFDATEFIGAVYRPSLRTVFIGPKASASTVIHEKIHVEQHKTLGEEFVKISEEVPRPEKYWELEREARRLTKLEEPVFKPELENALDKYFGCARSRHNSK